MNNDLIVRVSLDGWHLKDSDADLVFITDGKYGLPVIHRKDECRSRPNQANIMSGHPDVVKVLWEMESLRRNAGVPAAVDFCSNCMSAENK